MRRWIIAASVIAILVLVAIVWGRTAWLCVTGDYTRQEFSKPEHLRPIQRLKISQIHEVAVRVTFGRYAGSAILRPAQDRADIERLLEAVKTIRFAQRTVAVPSVDDTIVIRAYVSLPRPSDKKADITYQIHGYFDSTWVPVISPRRRSPTLAKVVEDIMSRKRSPGSQ